MWVTARRNAGGAARPARAALRDGTHAAGRARNGRARNGRGRNGRGPTGRGPGCRRPSRGRPDEARSRPGHQPAAAGRAGRAGHQGPAAGDREQGHRTAVAARRMVSVRAGLKRVSGPASQCSLLGGPVGHGRAGQSADHARHQAVRADPHPRASPPGTRRSLPRDYLHGTARDRQGKYPRRGRRRCTLS